MATLDGKKIKDTYKSLLKVGDNSTLDATLQEVTDGEGNTTGVSINTQGQILATGSIEAGSLKVTGATSDDFLKADGSLDQNTYATTSTVSNIESTLLAADAILQDNIDTETSQRIAADASLQAQVNTEATNLSNLTVRVNDSENDIAALTTEGDANAAAIVSEASTRLAADDALNASILSEAATRQSADTALNNQITAEASTRLSGDNTLQSNINTEESARIAADSLLQASINAEVTNRTAADTVLQNQITSNDSDITGLFTDKVPYTGATADVVLGLNALRSNTIQVTGGTGTEGTLTWNSDENTVDLSQNGVAVQLGQEVQINVRNNSGSTISNGSPVYATGAQGDIGRILIAPMIADGSILPKFFIGVATEDIADNADGKVTWFGKVRDIDTRPYLAGSALYVSETVAGEWQTTAPTAPNPTIEAGISINSKNNGAIFVRGDFGSDLNHLNDVLITNPQNEDALIYDSALGVWRNDGGVYQKIGDIEGNITVITGDVGDETTARILADNALNIQINVNEDDIADLQSGKEDKSNKSVANGYAPLDSGAKIPEAYLPDSIVGQLSYQGTWDASTNTPTLPDPTTVKGHYYVVSTAGTYLGENYLVGDWAISNGTAWEHLDNTDAVTTVFGRLGAIVANESDYTAFYPLISDLNAEVAARIAADGVLQGQLDTIFAYDVPATIARVTQNETDISSLDTRVTTNEGNISTNTGNISTNTSNIAANTFNVTGLIADVDDLQTTKQDNLTAGTGIDLTGDTVTNTAPDQTVVITGSGSTTVTGTYPTFNVESVGTEYIGGTGIDVTGATITNTAPDQTVSISGTGSTTVTGTYPNFSVSSTGTVYTAGTGLTLAGTEFQNTAPDQTVSITGGQGVTISGTYPAFTIDSVAGSEVIKDLFSGTGSQTVFTLSGTPINENYTQVFISGVYQEKSGYSLAGNVLTFSEAPAAGLDVEVMSITTITILGEVSSVNGQTGAVVLDTNDVAEGATNLYNATHTGDVTGSAALTISAGAVDGGKIANTADVQINSLGVGTAAPTTAGLIRATNDVVAYYSSDKRLKDNIKPIEGALDKVSKLGGYEFDWNNKQDVYEGHDIGVIAQEVEAVFPELVTTRDSGFKAVKYEKLVSVLIEAVKELRAEVETLKTK